jgi:hypothetical protein
MKITVRILALLFSIMAMSCSNNTPPIDVSGLSEASMNFDQEGVGPFLLHLSGIVGSEFDSAAAEKVIDAVDALDVEQIGNWEFRVSGNGSSQRLVIVAYKDDVDAPDLAFYTSPELAARIQEQLEAFATEQGW